MDLVSDSTGDEDSITYRCRCMYAPLASDRCLRRYNKRVRYIVVCAGVYVGRRYLQEALKEVILNQSVLQERGRVGSTKLCRRVLRKNSNGFPLLSAPFSWREEISASLAWMTLTERERERGWKSVKNVCARMHRVRVFRVCLCSRYSTWNAPLVRSC